MHDGTDRGIWIDNDHEVQFFHCLLHLRAACLAIRCMPPEHHGADVVLLRDVGLVFEHTVDPARYRNTLGVHRLGRLPLGLFITALVELSGQPVIVDIPDLCPVFPGTLRQTVITRQGVTEHAEVGGALYVVMTAEDVGAATGGAHVAECQLESAVGTGIVITDSVLRTTHAPDEGTRAIFCHNLRGTLDGLFRHPGDPFDFIRRPLRHLGTDIVHAVDTLLDELLVFPAVLEDVPEHAPDHRHIGAWTDTHVEISMRGGTGETRIDHNQRRIVAFRGMEDMLQGDRMCLGRVAADDQDRLAVVNIIVGIGHGTIAPGVGDTGYRGGMTDACLVVHVVGSPQGSKLAEQVGLFVVVFGRTQPVDGIRAGLLANGQHLVAELVNGLLPGHPGPLAIHQLGRIFQTAFAVTVLAYRGALGTVCTTIEGMIKGRFLASPHAVLDFCVNTATDRAMGTDGAYLFSRAAGCSRFSGSGCLLHHRHRQ